MAILKWERLFLSEKSFMTDTIDVRQWIGDSFPTICTFQSEEAAWIEESAWVKQAA